MNEQHIEDIITVLYDTIQDAKSLPLGADKCIIERDKVLDMLDEKRAEELLSSREKISSFAEALLSNDISS